MNFRKYIAAALVVVLAVPTVAQKVKTASSSQHKIENITDVDAAIKGIEAIVHNSLADVEPIVAQICESQQTKKQKCPEIYVGAANAFWTKSGIGDTTYAQRYIDKAIAIAPHYAPAYILKGDIYKWANNIVVAENYYKKAMEIAPTDIRGYNKYIAFKEIGLDKMCKDAMDFQVPEEIEEARVRRGEVEAIMKKAKENIPSYQYELEMARLYYTYSITSNELAKSLTLYQEACQDSLDEEDYTYMTGILYGFTKGADNATTKLNNYEKMLQICDNGLARFPKSYYILSNGLVNSNAAYNLVNGQRGEGFGEYKKNFSTKALEYAERLMATKDTLISNGDIYNYGQALIHRNKYDEGINVLKDLTSSPTATENQVSNAMNLICTAYGELGEYDKAENAYEELIATLEKKGTLQLGHFFDYATMLTTQAEESVGQEQVNVYMKADKVYERGAETFPEEAPRFYYFQMNLRANPVLDPDGTYELRLVPAKKIFKILGSKSSLSSTELSILGASLGPLVNYYLKKQNYAAVKPYLLKWHELEPDNEQITNLLRNKCKVKL